MTPIRGRLLAIASRDARLVVLAVAVVLAVVAPISVFVGLLVVGLLTNVVVTAGLVGAKRHSE